MEPIRSQQNRLAWKLFWAFLIISLVPIVVMLILAVIFSGEQLLGLPAYLQQRLLIALIALTLTTIGLVWFITARVGGRASALARNVRLAAQGRPAEMATVAGDDEIAETAQWFNRLADQLAHQQALLMNQDSEENTTRRQAAALVAQQALMAGSLDDLMRNAVDLFLRHFGCSFGALYLLESKELASKIHVTLAYTAGTLTEDAQPFAKRYANKRINLDQVPTMDWMVGRALGSRRPQVGPADANSVIYEAVLPLIQPSADGPRVIGALDLLSTSRVSDARVGPFSVRTVAEMQGIANVLALAIGGFTTAAAIRDGALPTHPGASQGGARLGSMRLDVESIYAASSQIAQARTVDQAMNALRTALRNVPYASAILVRPPEEWEPVHAHAGAAPDSNPPTPAGNMHVVICRALRTQPPGMNEPPLVLPSPRLAALEAFFLNRLEQENRHETGSLRNNPMPLMLYDLDMQEEGASTGDTPVELITIARRMGSRSAAYLPSFRNGQLAALLLIGAAPETSAPLFRPELLEPFQNLVHLAGAALERIHNASFTQRTLAEIDAFWQFTQDVSVETDLNVLLRRLHEYVEKVIGAVDSFAIGLYEAATNTIRIPYLQEGGQQLDIPAFPLGAGLSSEVIRTQKPLLLTTAEEIKSLSVELGSTLVGEEPRSWLGAPMIYAGEVVGLIIVQDTVQEERFTQSDAQLLATLAAQVAVVVRNARLLEASRRQARQERLVNEISGRIRKAADMQSILKTTADELAQALGARRASIRISLDAASGAGETASAFPSSPAGVLAAPLQREVTRPDPKVLAQQAEQPPMLEIPLVIQPVSEEPASPRDLQAAQSPQKPLPEAKPIEDAPRYSPVEPSKSDQPPSTRIQSRPTESQPAAAAPPAPSQPRPVPPKPDSQPSRPVSPQSAAAPAPSRPRPAAPKPDSPLSRPAAPQSAAAPTPSQPRTVSPLSDSQAAKPVSPQSDSLPPRPATPQLATTPAPSQPRPNSPAAFTLDLQPPSAGSGINPPTGPRVSPFIEPEQPNPEPNAPNPPGAPAPVEKPSATGPSAATYDAQKRLQNANTQPLTNPFSPTEPPEKNTDEGKAGK